MSSIRRLIRAYVLLSVLRSRHYLSSVFKRKSLKRIIAFRLMKLESKRVLALKRACGMRRPRRWHVRPIYRNRTLHGAWFSLIPIMRQEDHDQFFKFMRMTPDTFDWVLEKVSPALLKTSNARSISPGERLAVTLRYLASGESMASIAYLFRLSNQVVSNIIFETTAAIWFALRNEVFPPLTKSFWRQKASEFEAMWQFPLCVGAIDGKHCNVQKFPMRGSEYYNYKQSHSLLLLAVADAKYKFIVVDVGARGRESDGGVFERSQFGQLYSTNQLELPPDVFREDVNAYQPFVFLGDAAFSFDKHLMKPFDQGSNLMPEERIFNYRLSRARRVVENAFGILSARFRILRTHIIGSETLVQNIILACTALHNLHLMREDSIPPKQRIYLPPGFVDAYRSNGKIKRGRWRKECLDLQRSIFRKLSHQEMEGARTETASGVREKFMEYFVQCPVPWQLQSVFFL